MALPLLLTSVIALAGFAAAPPPEDDDSAEQDAPEGEDDDDDDEVGDEDGDADDESDADESDADDDESDAIDEPEPEPDDEPEPATAAEPPANKTPSLHASGGAKAGGSAKKRGPTAGSATVFVDGGSPDPAKKGEPPRFLQPLVLGKDALVLGGYIQPGFIGVADTEFNQDDQEGFDFANARLTGRGKATIHEQLYLGFKFNFDVNKGNFAVRDVYGTIAWRDDLIRVDVGQLKQPFGLSLLQSQARMQFALSPESRRLAFGRDQGVQLQSQATLGRRFWIHGAFMMANGEGGFRQRRNLDDKFQYTGRLEVGPLGEVPLSEPDLDNSDPKFVLAANAGHTQSLGKGLGLGDVGAVETRVGGDARFHFRGLSARVEYLHGFRAANGDDSPAFQRWAVSAQAGYVLPIPLKIPKFEVVFRYTQLDVNTELDGTEDTDYVVDNTEVRYIEPGLTIYLAGHAAKLHLSYLLTDLLEGPRVDVNGDPLIGDTFFAFFQFAWL